MVEVAPTRFTLEEFDRLAESSLFDDRRFELVDGSLLMAPPPNFPHFNPHSRLANRLARALPARLVIAHGASVLLDESVFAPDLIVFEGGEDDYDRTRSDLIRIVVEISSSTLAYDRGRKAEAYARAGIPEYWIVDVAGRAVEVRTEPEGDAYRALRTYRTGDALPHPGGQLPVSEILP